MRARQRHLKPKSIGAFIALDSRYINQSDNTAVSSWADISGSGNNATQANSPLQPTFQTAELGGNGVVRFDGSNDLLVISSLIKAQPFTSFLVSCPRQTKSGGYNEMFQSTNLGLSFAIVPTLTYEINGGLPLPLSIANASLNSWFIGSGIYNGSSSSITVNGGNKTTGNAGNKGINGAIHLGGSWNLGQYYNNDWAFAFACEGAFSDALRKRCEHSAAYSFKIACS